MRSLLLGAMALGMFHAQASTLHHLRCEYLSDPLGIDVAHPRLSWKLESGDLKPERRIRQSAYQILAASSKDLLRNDQADLWDSGKVASDETAQIAYGGWPSNSGAWYSFQPIIENCIRLEFNYAYQSGNLVDWTTDPNTPPSPGAYSSLPLGVLVTISVIDSKTAERLSALSSSALTAADITAGINAANGNGETENQIQRLISQGADTMSRFIPFNSQ